MENSNLEPKFIDASFCPTELPQLIVASVFHITNQCFRHKMTGYVFSAWFTMNAKIFRTSDLVLGIMNDCVVQVQEKQLAFNQLK